MTTAQRILTNGTARAIEAEARDLAMKTEADCFVRTWTFYDGSSIIKTRAGYTAEMERQLRWRCNSSYPTERS